MPLPDDPAPADRLPPAKVIPPQAPDPSALVTLVAGVVVVASLYLAREVLIPVTIAVLLSFLLAPLANLLRDLRLGRVGSVIIAVLLAVGVILALGGLIGTQIAQLADKATAYETTIEHKIDVIRGATIGRLSDLMTSVGERVGERVGLAHAPAQTQTQQQQQQPRQQQAAGAHPAPVQVQQAPPSAVALAESVLVPVVSPLVTAVLVFIVTIFVLLQREDLRDRLIRLFGSGDLHRTTGAMDDAARRLSRYFLAQLCINATFGCVIGIGLAVIGIPSPVLWGTLAMILRFVPYIGVPLASVLPLVLAAAVVPGWSLVVWTAALFFGSEAVTGQAIEPVLYGRSTGLSPAAVIIAAIFWTWIWGPIGLLLSTPLTLCMVVLGRHFKRLEFLAVLLGDRPALSPVESFYQRMLAGDPDEAEDQAEVLLRDIPLSSYYDEIALPGLQLAAADAARGVLRVEQIDALMQAVDALVRDLDDHDDGKSQKEQSQRERSQKDRPMVAPRDDMPQADMSDLPPGWDSEAPILCVAGRGPLDAAPAAMLAQLLGKHGLVARTLPHEAVSRTQAGNLDANGIGMLCILYLEINGTPAHLRFMLRRLRQRFPDQPILVGLWPARDEIMRDARLRESIGADYYANSLHHAVTCCLEAVRRGGRPHPRYPDVDAPFRAVS